MKNPFSFLNGRNEQPVNNLSGMVETQKPLNSLVSNKGQVYEKQSPWKQALINGALLGIAAGTGGAGIPIALAMSGMGGYSGYNRARDNNAYIDYESTQGQKRAKLLNSNDSNNQIPDDLGYVSETDFKNYQNMQNNNWKQEYQRGQLDNKEQQLKIMETLNNLKIQNDNKNKNMTMQEILNTLKITNPDEAQAYMKKYDFSMNPDGTQRNAGLLNMELPNSAAQQIINGTIPLNMARTKNINTKTDYIPVDYKIKKQNADSKRLSATKPRAGSKPKLEDSQTYRNDLAEYLSVKDPAKKEWGRQELIRRYGVDPDKKLQQANTGYGR